MPQHPFPRPWFAFVGRPNVGKSTLFNRLIGRRVAVVDPARGTTRDRLHSRITWNDVSWTLVDTGGLDFSATTALDAQIREQVDRAVQEADGLLFVCDGGAGPIPQDHMIADRVRVAGKPVVVVANKTDRRGADAGACAVFGFDPVFGVSALHGRGTGELLDHLASIARAHQAKAGTAGAEQTDDSHTLSLAIVGRQNVGKSSLVNALLRDVRVIVHDRPGTTRDAVDTVLWRNGAPIVLIDTAGLRHRRKVREVVDVFSMQRTAGALARCDVALVILDGTQGVTNDDQRIIAQVCDAGCGVVLLVNKWDLVKGGSEKRLDTSLRRMLPTMTFAPILAVSAKTGFQVGRSLTIAQQVFRRLRTGISQTECQMLMDHAWRTHLPPRIRGRLVRLRSAQWVPGRPPAIELSTAPVGQLPQPYRHYLMKRLHASPGLVGVPVRLVVRASERAAHVA